MDPKNIDKQQDLAAQVAEGLRLPVDTFHFPWPRKPASGKHHIGHKGGGKVRSGGGRGRIKRHA